MTGSGAGRRRGRRGIASKPKATAASAPDPPAPADIAHEVKYPGAGEFVSWLVKCLYVDEALPRGQLLQWQLQLLLGVKLGNNELRDLVRTAPGVYMEPDSAPELAWSALLRTPPPGFRGFKSEEQDPAWEDSSTSMTEAERVFALGGWPEAGDRHHRYYVVASWLQDSSERLRTLSFGRLLSLVYHGVSHGHLGRCAGQLVPYKHCDLYERVVNARNCQPTGVGEGESYVSTWGEFRSCLRKLLAAAGPTQEVEMARLKALFRSNFGMELSETAFGYESLSKLFGDPEVATEFVMVPQPLVCSGACVLRARPQKVSLASLIGEGPEGAEDETVAAGQEGAAALAA